MLVKAAAKNIDINLSSDTTDAYDVLGNRICTFTTSYNMDMTMEFHCVPFDGHLLEVRSV